MKDVAIKSINLLFILSILSCCPLASADSTKIGKGPTYVPQTRIGTVDTSTVTTTAATYTSSGNQALPSCPPNTTLVRIKNESQQIYYGPAKNQTYCSGYGSCSGFGCWCAGSSHSCCVWCDPPCNSWTTVSMQWYNRNDLGGTYTSGSSVLSSGVCAAVGGTWAPSN